MKKKFQSCTFMEAMNVLSAGGCMRIAGLPKGHYFKTDVSTRVWLYAGDGTALRPGLAVMRLCDEYQIEIELQS